MLSHKKPDSVINVKVEFGEGEGKVPLDNIAKRAEAYKPKERVTYKMIKELRIVMNRYSFCGKALQPSPHEHQMQTYPHTNKKYRQFLYYINTV